MARTGRKTMPAAEQPADNTNFEALAEAGKAATALVVMEEEAATRVRAVAVQLGYDLPADSIDPDLIQRDIAANMRRSVEACLEVGRGLCVLKAVCEHGGFMQRLESLGIEDRVARRFMQSALKFTKRATSPVLTAAGSQSKLFELLVLDDEQLDELELTGQTGELALDDIATMSVKELRTALREANAEAEAKDRLIEDKNKKLDELDAKLSRPFKPKKGSPAKTADDAAALDELNDATNSVDAQLARLAVVANELQEHPSEALRARAQHALEYLVARMREVIGESGITVRDGDDMGQRPEWLDQKA